MPIHKAILPTTSGGTYGIRGRGLKRLGGEGLKRAALGMGMGSVLLDGGMGGQSSYPSIAQYKATTGVNPLVKGKGLEALSGKISGLSIQPKKKSHNIKFEL